VVAVVVDDDSEVVYIKPKSKKVAAQPDHWFKDMLAVRGGGLRVSVGRVGV
jgi:hypothetical protein